MNSQIVFTKIYWKFVGQYFKQLKKKKFSLKFTSCIVMFGLFLPRRLSVYGFLIPYSLNVKSCNTSVILLRNVNNWLLVLALN